MIGFTIAAGPFSAALAAVSAAISPRAFIPHLTCVRLDWRTPPLGAAALVMTGSNLDLEIRRTIEVSGTGDAVICVNANRLLSWAKLLSNNAKIKFEFDDGFLAMKSGRSKLTLQTLDADAYPAMKADFDNAVKFNFNGDLLREIFSKITALIAPSGTGPDATSGVHIAVQRDRKKLIIQAGSNHNIARHTFELPLGAFDIPENGIIIPPGSAKAFGDLGGIVTIEITGSLIRIGTEAAFVTSKLIDQTYLNVSRIIPDDFEFNASFETADMLLALSRTAVTQNDNDKANIVRLFFSDNTVSLSSHGKSNGSSDAEDSIDARCEGEYRLTVNSRMLIDQLRVLNAETVDLQISPQNGPHIFTVPNDETKMVIAMRVRG